MTEQQLRGAVVAIMRGWMGAVKGDHIHRRIIDTYNSHTPLPRGVRMSYTMDWCAATVSAAGIAAGLTSIMPVECSCGLMIKLYQQMGRWVEDDNYIPAPADLIMYDWDDDGRGDNRGAPEHVGMVETVDRSKGTITIIEGNMGASSVVGRRTIPIGGRYIRGYCCPDYASIADKLSAADPDAKAPWYAESWAEATELGLVDGTRPEAPVTRAECATIVLRALAAQKGEK